MPSNTDGIRSEIKAEQEKLKDKSFKERLSYFIYYYKFHVLIGTAVAIFLISCIYTMATKKQPVFYCSMINTSGFYESADEMAADFGKYAGINEKKQEIVLDTSLKISGSDGKAGNELAYNSLAKMMAMLNAGTLDGLIGNDEVLDTYGKDGALIDLKEVLSPAMYTELEKDNKLYFVTSNDNTQIAVGVDLKDSKKLKDAGLYKSDDVIYYASPSLSKHLEMSETFLDYLLNN